MAMAEILDRRMCKARAASVLRGAQVPAVRATALYFGLVVVLNLLESFGSQLNLFSSFLSILTGLLTIVLEAGFILYCMAIRRQEYAGYMTLFNGFGDALRIILLSILRGLFIGLWSMLFVIPGIVAAYRYRFALYNLLENPQLGVMDAIRMSKHQTYGYKTQLFMLDLSYLGWIILALLPMLYYNQVLSFRLQAAFMQAGSLEEFLYSYPPVSGAVMGLSALTWQVIIAVWGLVVSLFYLPHYYCVNLEYFDAAKRSSGTGVLPQDPYNGFDGNNGNGFNGNGYNGGFDGTDSYNGFDRTSGGQDNYGGGSQNGYGGGSRYDNDDDSGYV